MSLLSINSYTLLFLRYGQDKILWVKVTMARSKVKSRSHHDDAHLQPLTNVPTKYQLPTPYSFRHIARTRFYRSRLLRQGQRSTQGHTMMLHIQHPLTNVPTKHQLPTPMVSEIYPGQYFKGQGHHSKVKSRSHHDVAYLHPLTNVPNK